MFQRHRGKHHKQIHLCLLFLVGKPISVNAKLILPIIPIGFVAYALTLLWDNLCRNSCKHPGMNGPTCEQTQELVSERTSDLFKQSFIRNSAAG